MSILNVDTIANAAGSGVSSLGLTVATISLTTTASQSSATLGQWYELSSALRLPITVTGNYLVQASLPGNVIATIGSGAAESLPMFCLSTSSTPPSNPTWQGGFAQNQGPMLQVYGSGVEAAWTSVFSTYQALTAGQTIYAYMVLQKVSSASATAITLTLGSSSGNGASTPVAYIRAIQLPT